MKVKDMLKEEYGLVIKGKNGFRVDPDPAHHFEEWENAWTDDLSKAHPFTQKEARRFLTKRAQDHRTEHEARTDLKFIPVDVIDGVPAMPQKKGGVLGWLRQA